MSRVLLLATVRPLLLEVYAIYFHFSAYAFRRTTVDLHAAAINPTTVQWQSILVSGRNHPPDITPPGQNTSSDDGVGQNPLPLSLIHI